MVKQKVVMLRFLIAFFIYSMGVQTVMLLAPLFGDKEVGMTANEMIFVVLDFTNRCYCRCLLFCTDFKVQGKRICNWHYPDYLDFYLYNRLFSER